MIRTKSLSERARMTPLTKRLPLECPASSAGFARATESSGEVRKGAMPPPSVLEDADGRHDVSTDESEGLEHQPMVARDVAHHHLLEAQPAIVPEPLDHGVRAAYEELGLAR